jgi:hypothetical protein
MPSLRVVAHDGWLRFTALYNSSWGSISTQLGSSCQGNRYGTEKAGGMAPPSHTKPHLPGHFPPASQAGRRVGPAL